MSENVARRRMRRVFPGSAAVMMLAAVALSGCGGDPTLYTVAATPGVSTSGGPLVVEVRTPVVSASIDRDEIVRQEQDYKLHMAKGDAWSAPLGDMIGRTLTRDLAQRLPGTTVFAQNDAVSTMPLGFVELTVTAFNTDQQGRAVLEAMLAVHGVHGTIGPVQTVPVQLSMKLDGHATGMLVAALSQMLGQVADIAAQHIRTLPVALPPVQAASL